MSLENNTEKAKCPYCGFIYDFKKNEDKDTLLICPQCSTHQIVYKNHKDFVNVNWGEKEYIEERKKENVCAYCGVTIDSLLPWKCKRCGKIFCKYHRLPESHDCLFLREKWERWKIEQSKFK